MGQLIAFKGRCSFRQFMPSKPAKYGLKIWLAVDSKSGYMWMVQPYLGKPRNAKPEKKPRRTRCIGLERAKCNRRQFFSTFELVRKFHEKKLTYVGTLQKKKTFIPPKLLMVKKLLLYTSIIAFNDIATLVSYVNNKNNETILIFTMHKTAAIDESELKKKPEIVSYYN